MNDMKEKAKAIPPRYIYTYEHYIESTLQQHVKTNRFFQSDFIKEVVNSIANGLDIKNIDPRLYPIVMNPLESKKDDFLFGSNRNLSAAKTISKSIDQIHRYYLNQEKERKKVEEIEQNKKNQETFLENQKKNSKILTRNDIENAVSIVLEYEKDKSNVKLIKKIDPEIHSYLIDELRALKAEAILRNDFKMAEKYENSIRTVTLLESENKYSEITKTHAYELQQKYMIALNDYKKLQSSWQKKISAIDQQIDQQIKEIQNETDQILIEFDKQFLTSSNEKVSPQMNTSTQNDNEKQNAKLKNKIEHTNSNFEEEFSTKFRPSVKLRELRKSERSLAMAKRFEEARIMKKQNDKLEQIERNEFINRFNSELERRRKEIIKKQQNTINIIYQKGQQKLTVAHKQMNEQLNQAERALRHLEDSVNEANKIASLSFISYHSSNDENTLNSNGISYHASFSNADDLSCSRSKSFSHFENSNKNDKINVAKSDGILEMHPLKKSGQFNQCTTSRGKTRKQSILQPNNQQCEQNLFYKRRMINSVVYSRSSRQTDMNRFVRFSK